MIGRGEGQAQWPLQDVGPHRAEEWGQTNAVNWWGAAMESQEQTRQLGAGGGRGKQPPISKACMQEHKGQQAE